MDEKQISSVLEYMFGFKVIGTAGDEAIYVPYAPELRAVVEGHLGNYTPFHGLDARSTAKAARIAAFFRAIANGIDPEAKP